MAKIVAYNPFQVYKNLSTIPSEYLADLSLVEWYQKNEFMYRGIIDRTRTIGHFLNITDVFSTIPKYEPTFFLDFEDICRIRALDILHRVPGRIYIMWSGGLDSTCILAAFAEIKAPKDKIVIVGTLGSLIESGDLFDSTLRHIFPNYLIGSGVTDEVIPDLSENDAIITGLLGNQVTGGVMRLYNMTYDQMMRPYQDILLENEVEAWAPITAACPRKIETYFDWMSWQRFSQNWVQCPHAYKISFPMSHRKAMTAFYDDVLFERWFISSKEPKVSPMGDLKWPMRKFITLALGTYEYAYLKRETPSILKAQPLNWMFYLDDDRVIFAE